MAASRASAISNRGVMVQEVRKVIARKVGVAVRAAGVPLGIVRVVDRVASAPAVRVGIANQSCASSVARCAGAV